MGPAGVHRGVPNRIRRATARLALAGMLVASSGVPAVYAEPVGEQVQAGDASFSRDGNVTQITASDGSIIEYTSFDIFEGETVEFIQPSEMARVLNRVLDGSRTQIDGSLLANGRVYIVNPAGIFFGGEAIIDVGALIAAAGSVTDDDFLTGVDQFTSVMGSVENRGAIEAGSVMLLGRTVANHGSILAPSGMIAMIAGEEILLSTLDGKLLIQVDDPAADPVEFDAVTQAGTIATEGGDVIFTTGDVYSLALNHTGMTSGGSIRIESGDGLVEIAGTLDVSGIEDVNEGAGGSIEIEAGGSGDVAVTGNLIATGANLGAGGTVSITTDDGSIGVADIDASGANAGAITLAANGVGDVTLNGSLRADSETPTDSGAGGGVTVTSAGALAVGDPSGPHIVTTEDVTLDAASIGAAETLVIDGGGVVDSRLSITAEGVVDVRVDQEGFDRIELTQRDASGNVDFVQRSGDPMFTDDEVHIVGEAGTSTVARVTGSSRTSFRYELKDAASEIRISTGGIETGGSTVITSGGDIVIGNGPGTAIEMREGAGLTLRAGADADGTGTIRVDGAAVIVMSGAEETAGRLELTAGEGVGTALAPIVTEGIGELAGSTGAGGFHLENKGLDELVIVGGVVPGLLLGGDSTIANEADIVIRGESGTAIRMLEGKNLTLRADSDADGSGAIGVDGAALIVMSGAGETAGRLELTAGEGVGTATAPIRTEGIGELTGSTEAGGFHFENTGFGELVIIAGDDPGLSLRGDSTIANVTDIVIGNGPGTAIEMLDGAGLSLQADADEDGIGTIEVDGAALIAMSTASTLAGRLELTAGAGVGTQAAPIQTEGIGELTGSTEAGGFHLENTSSGELVLRIGAMTVGGEVDLSSVGDIFLGNLCVGPGCTAPIQSDAAVTLRADSDGDGAGDLVSAGLGTHISTAGDVTLDAANIGAAQSLVIDGGGSADSRLAITADGAVDVSVDVKGFDRIELTQRDASGDVDLTQDGGDRISIDGASGISTVTTADTQANGAVLTYTLNDENGADLVIASGSMRLGGAGTLVNKTGALLASGTGPHIITANDLTLDAVSIGAAETLVIDGMGLADSRLAITAEGVVDVRVDQQGFDRIELTQRDASGAVDVSQAEGADRIRIRGNSGGATSPAVSSIVEAVTRDGISLSYHLEDSSAAAGADPLDATLAILAGAMTLGDDLELSSTGDIVLGNLCVGPGCTAPISSDAAVTLRADSDGDGAGDLVTAGLGTHISTSGDVTLDAPNIGAAQSLAIEGGGSADSRLAIAADGDVDVRIDEPGFDRIELTQRDASGNTDIVQTGSDFLLDELHIVGGAGTNTLTADTSANGTTLTYTLDDENGAELAIGSGAVTLGGAGTLVNKTGALVAVGAGPHITTGHELNLEATTIGSGQPLIIDGSGEVLRLTSAGRMDVVAQSGFAAIELTQRDATGRVDVTLAGGDRIAIEGAPGISTVTIADTRISGAALTYILDDENGADLGIERGSVTLRGAGTLATKTGDLVAIGAGIHIETTEDLSLEAAAIGASRRLAIDGGGIADSLLAITASGVVNVDVDETGFDRIELTQRDARGDIDLTQGGDLIDIDGASGTSSLVGVRTGSSGTAFRYELEDGASRVVIETGSMSMAGETVIASGGDIVIGDGQGTAIEMLNGKDLTLRADSDADGTGAIEVVGRASIEMSRDANAAGRLELMAGEGVGTAVAPIRTQGIEELAGSTEAGGFHLENTTTGELVLRTGALTVSGEVELSSVGDIALRGPDICVGPGCANVRSDAEVTLRADSDGNGVGDLIVDGFFSPHISTPGDVSLDAANIGATETLVIDGGGSADSRLAITVDGVVDVSVDGKGFDRIDLTQRDAAGDIDLTLVDGDRIDIDGASGTSTVVTVDTTANGTAFRYELDDGASEILIRTAGMTMGGATVIVNDGDIVIGDAEGTAIELIGAAALTLQSTNGAIRGPAQIALSGAGEGDEGLILKAGLAIGSDDEPIRTSGIALLSATAEAGDVFVENEGSGDIVIGMVQNPDLQGGVLEEGGINAQGEAAEIKIVNRAGNIELRDVHRDGSEGPTIRSDLGDRLTLKVSGDGKIIFDANAAARQVRTRGHQEYQGDVLLAKDALLRVNPSMDVLSSMDIVFTGSVDSMSDSEPSSLEVQTSGTTEFQVAVGKSNPLRELTTDEGGKTIIRGDAVVTTEGQEFGDAVEVSGPTVFTSGTDIEFRETLDSEPPQEDGALPAGNASLIAGEGDVRFRGGVGTQTPLAGLDVDASGNVDFERAVSLGGDSNFSAGGSVAFFSTLDGPGGVDIEVEPEGVGVQFSGDVGREEPLRHLILTSLARVAFLGQQVVATGDIRLNPDTIREIPPIATIVSESVVFEAGGEFEMGRHEKLTAVGALTIRAVTATTIADLSALDITVDAPSITVLGRDPAEVRLPDGTVPDKVQDEGGDIVAETVTFTSTPDFKGPGETPTIATLNGAVRTPGSLDDFSLRLLDGRLGVDDFIAADGTVLDLVAQGPRFLENPASQVVREEAAVAPFLDARIGDAAPAPATRVSADAMLGFLRCASTGGATLDDCARQVLPPVAAGLSTSPYGMLGTPRAREAAVLHRNLLAEGEPPDGLREAWAVTLEDYQRRARVREVDGVAFRAVLDRSSDASSREVLAYLHRIAELSIRIRWMGLSGEAFHEVELAILSELADRLGDSGISVEALRDAVNADYPGPIETTAKTPFRR